MGHTEFDYTAEILLKIPIDYLSALWQEPWAVGAAIAFVSLVANAEFYRRFQASIRSAPRLDPIEDSIAALPTITVVVPAYNEAANITDCLTAILANEWPGSAAMQVMVADDESTDETLSWRRWWLKKTKE